MNNINEWVAKTVAQAILNSGLSLNEVANRSGIPYSTLNRKVKGVRGTFDWLELLSIAEATGVHPSTFTPPAFNSQKLAA